MKTVSLYRSIARKLLGGILFILLAQISTAVHAQFPLPPTQSKPCKVEMCFPNPAAKAEYERENKCVFGTACGNELTYDSKQQCCGKDLKTGNPQIHDKFQTGKNTSVNNGGWDDYKKQCPDMTQNTAPPDALWAKCEKGKPHDPNDDEWNVIRVEENGSARQYCIDGCSTPKKVVASLYANNRFLANDKDNPTGYSASSSFFTACANHDKCYQTCNIGVDRAQCDDALERDMRAACATIPADRRQIIVEPTIEDPDPAANQYYREACTNAIWFMMQGVRKLAGDAFKKRRTQYCKCCQ